VQKESRNDKFSLVDLWGFIKSRLLTYTLIRMGIFLLLIWLLNSLLLNLYTNHGQKLRLTNFVGQPLFKARKMAASRDYELVILDSVHLIGKPGGYVLNQVPKPNSFVKRGRKVYITISRFKADEILSDNIPNLYGEKYDFKKQEFESLYHIKLMIAETRYDPGPSGHILEASYHGMLLANEENKAKGLSLSKGDTVLVVISVDRGGEIDVPQLRCKTLGEAKLELSAMKIELGNINQEGDIEDQDNAYIIRQEPTYEKGKKIKMGSSVQLTISQTYPDDCEPR